MDGEFGELEPPARLVNVERYEGAESLCTLELEERDGCTTLTQTMRFGSRAARDVALRSGMTDGMGLSYDRLAAVLAELAALA